MPTEVKDRRDALIAAFRERFGRLPAWLGEAPGRVNLIGEHTDYNDGLVLPAAIDRTVLVAGASSTERVGRVWSLDLGEDASFDAARPERSEHQPWVNYVRGLAWALAEEGYRPAQIDLAVQGNVPMGSGLSSSAALEVAVGSVVATAAGVDLSPLQLARLAHRAEVEFVGVPCGIMDQFVSSLAMTGHALLIDCRTEETEPVPLDLEAQGVLLVVVESGVSRRLAGSDYRERRQQCEEAVGLLRSLLRKNLTSLRDVSHDELLRVADSLPDTLLRRARHVVSENARVLDFVRDLREGDLEDTGPILAESHRSLRDDYEVSSAELDLLVSLASAMSGVIGARLTGAGFGGCTVNLVHSDALGAFERRVVQEYGVRTGRAAHLRVFHAAGGASLTVV